MEKQRSDVIECPVGILVDIPCTLQPESINYNLSATSKEFVLKHEDISIIKIQDSTERISLGFESEISSKDVKKNKNEDPKDEAVFLLNSVKSEIAVSRPRWITPSPQSMSRISKEVSKVLDNLNSSLMVENDISLNEEKLPIPINFDFDDMIFEKNNLANVEENINQSILVCSADFKDSQIEDPLKLSNNKVDEASQPVLHSGQEDVVLEKIDTSDNVLTKHISHNKSEYNITQFFPCEDEVFFAKQISNDKKTMIQKANTIECSKENSKTHKIHDKNSVTSKKGYESSCKIDRKVTVIDSKITKQQNKTTKTHIKITKSDSLAFQPSPGSKSKVRNSFSMIPPAKMSRPVTRSNSCQIQNKTDNVSKLKTYISHGQEANYIHPSKICRSVIQNSCSTNSFTAVKSKGYPVVSLSKDTVVKPPATPAFPSYSNLPKHRFTLQSAPRLSFSRSLQDVSSSFHSSKSNVLREQNPIPFKLGLLHGQPFSARVEKHDIQSTSMLSKPNEKIALSTSSRKRFCSKLSLPSPLPVSFDKQLARALFPNSSED